MTRVTMECFSWLRGSRAVHLFSGMFLGCKRGVAGGRGAVARACPVVARISTAAIEHLFVLDNCTYVLY